MSPRKLIQLPSHEQAQEQALLNKRNGVFLGLAWESVVSMSYPGELTGSNQGRTAGLPA
jgi:hypothetical protein